MRMIKKNDNKNVHTYIYINIIQNNILSSTLFLGALNVFHSWRSTTPPPFSPVVRHTFLGLKFCIYVFFILWLIVFRQWLLSISRAKRSECAMNIFSHYDPNSYGEGSLLTFIFIIFYVVDWSREKRKSGFPEQYF